MAESTNSGRDALRPDDGVSGDSGKSPSQGSRRDEQQSFAEAIPKRWVVDGACCLAILGVCLVLGLPRYRIGIDLADEGFLAYGAVRVLDGQLPNRDFVSFQPPLSFYTVASVFSILGTSLLTLRIYGLILYVVIPLLVYAIARQRASHLVSVSVAVPATMMGMPYFHFVPFAVWHGVAASLIAVLCMIRAARTGRKGWALWSGAATALTLLSRHDQGFYVALSVLAYVLALGVTNGAEVKSRSRRLFLSWAVGMAVPLSLLGACWFAAGAIPAMFQQLVAFPLTTYAETSSLPMPVFRSGLAFRDLLIVSMFYVPPIVDGAVGVWLLMTFFRRQARVAHAHLAFLVVLSTLFYCQVLTRSDLHHLLIILAPFFVVVAWTLPAVLERLAAAAGKLDLGAQWSRAARPALFAVPVLLGVGILAELKPVLLTPTDQPLAALTLPRGGVSLDPQDVSSIEKVVGVMQRYAPPDRSVLVLPYSPMLYFLSERRNPTRWNYLWPGDQSPEDHQLLIEQAQKDPPAVAAVLGEDELRKFAKPVVDYINSRFGLVQDFGGLRIYVPKSP